MIHSGTEAARSSLTARSVAPINYGLATARRRSIKTAANSAASSSSPSVHPSGDVAAAGAGEADHGVRQPVRAPRGGGAGAQGGAVRAAGGGPVRQERPPADAQPHPPLRPGAPPRRPRRLRVPPHRRVRRRGLPRLRLPRRRRQDPARRPLRPRHRPLLGRLRRHQVPEAAVAVDVDGRRRGAGEVRRGDEGEPGGAGRGAPRPRDEVLRRRRPRLRRPRRLHAGALARRAGGGGRGAPRGGGRVPVSAAVGRRVHLPRGRQAVPAGQGPARRLLRRQQGEVQVHGRRSGALGSCTSTVHITARSC